MGDVAQLGIHPGGRNQHCPATAGGGGVHVGHVEPVAQRHVGPVDGVHVLEHRDTLTRQRGLLHLQGSGLKQAAVGRNLVSGLKQNDVTRHQVVGRHLADLPVAAHTGLKLHLVLERGQAGRRLGLLPQAEDCVKDGEGQEQGEGATVAQGDQGDDTGDQQDDLH